MRTYKQLVEAFSKPTVTGKTAHGQYSKVYRGQGWCDAGCDRGTGERQVSVYKFRWRDHTPTEGAAPEKHWGHFCSLKCHQRHSGDEYDEHRAGRSYVKPGENDS